MSFYDEDGEDGDQNGRRNPLRDTVNNLEKQLKKLQDDLKERDDALTQERKTNRQRTVADTLKDKGADPRLARYVLQDVEDPTPEAVNSWLATEGELFGYKPQAATDPAQALGLPTGTALPPDLVAAYEKFAAGQQGGQAATVSGEANIAAKLADPNLTQTELLNLIAGAGN